MRRSKTDSTLRWRNLRSVDQVTTLIRGFFIGIRSTSHHGVTLLTHLVNDGSQCATVGLGYIKVLLAGLPSLCELVLSAAKEGKLTKALAEPRVRFKKGTHQGSLFKSDSPSWTHIEPSAWHLRQRQEPLSFAFNDCKRPFSAFLNKNSGARTYSLSK
jgi:hypothetical protein